MSQNQSVSINALLKKAWNNHWIEILVGLVISIAIGKTTTMTIDYGREHGWGAISAIFTLGRQSTENILGSLSPAFSLFSAISVTISFFILGKVLDNHVTSKFLNKIAVVAIIAFSVLISGFFSNLYFIVLSNSTGSVIPLETVYRLIEWFIVGLGFVIMALGSIVTVVVRHMKVQQSVK